jgi:hypothetical protein
MTYPNHVLRRAEFLLNEARNGFSKRDIAITMTLRSLSNYLTVGEDGGSRKVKELNSRMSENAKDLKAKLSSDDWHDATTNEHQLELKSVWSEILESTNQMTAEKICDLLKQYPYITVTNEENKALRRVKDAKSPEERYAKAGIVVLAA